MFITLIYTYVKFHVHSCVGFLYNKVEASLFTLQQEEIMYLEQFADCIQGIQLFYT